MLYSCFDFAFIQLVYTELALNEEIYDLMIRNIYSFLCIWKYFWNRKSTGDRDKW